MATPIGHALGGYLVYESTVGMRRGDAKYVLPICLFMAMSPDLDFFPGIFKGQPPLYHQGISHSFIFAGIISLFVAGLYRLFMKTAQNTPQLASGSFTSRKAPFLGNWMLFFLAYSSHLVIDLFGPDARPPYGIPLFWPFSSETFLSPFQIFLGVRHAHTTTTATTEWMALVLHPYNLGAIAIEVFVFLPFLILLKYLNHNNKHSRV